MPYGGVKLSGTGRKGPKYAIEEMTEPTLVCYAIEEMTEPTLVCWKVG
jgi:acyl-CoA reductase-like NAD-dependent aldehyde dehydrogenase